MTLSRGGVEVVKVTQTDPNKTTFVTYSLQAIIEIDPEKSADARHKSVEAQLNALVDLIHAKIAPDSWNADEVTALIYRSDLTLVVRQTDTNHQAISKLLKELHELKSANEGRDPGAQALQRAELADLAQRMKSMQQSIDMRDKLADKVVEKRVEDLLNPNPRDASQPHSPRGAGKR